jgi:hypothetical protein
VQFSTALWNLIYYLPPATVSYTRAAGQLLDALYKVVRPVAAQPALHLSQLLAAASDAVDVVAGLEGQVSAAGDAASSYKAALLGLPQQR